MKFNEEELARIKAVIILDDEKRHSAMAVSRLIKQKKLGIGKARNDRIIDNLFGGDSLNIFLGDGVEEKFAKLKRIYTTLLELLQRDQALAEFCSNQEESTSNILFYNLIELLNENESFFLPETSHNLKRILGIFYPPAIPDDKEVLAGMEMIGDSEKEKLPTTLADILTATFEIYGCEIYGNILLPKRDGALLDALATIDDFEGEILEKKESDLLKELGLPITDASERNISYLRIKYPDNLLICFNSLSKKREIISFNQILNNIYLDAYVNRYVREKTYSYEKSLDRLFLILQFNPVVETNLRKELDTKYRTIFERTIESGRGFGLQYFVNDEDLVKIFHDTSLDVLAYIFLGYENLQDGALSFRLEENRITLSHDSEDIDRFIDRELLSNDSLSGIRFEEASENPLKKTIRFYISDPFFANISSLALIKYLAQKAANLKERFDERDRLYAIFFKSVNGSLEEIRQIMNAGFKLSEDNLFTFPFTAENFAHEATLISAPTIINKSKIELAKKISALELEGMKFIYDNKTKSIRLEISKSASFGENVKILKDFFTTEYNKSSIDDLAALIEGPAKKGQKPKTPKQKKKSIAPAEPSSATDPLTPVTTTALAPTTLPSPKSAPPLTLPIGNLVTAAAIALPPPPTAQEDSKPGIEELTKEKLAKDLETFLKNRAKKLKIILGSDLQGPIINLGENFLSISFRQSQNPDITSEPLIRTDFNIHNNELVFYADLRLGSLEEIKDSFSNFIKTKILTKPPCAIKTLIEDIGAEDRETAFRNKTLQQEMDKFFYHRSLLDYQITEPEALCALIAETRDLSGLLDEISSEEDPVRQVIVYGSILHNKFPSDVDISLIIPSLTLNTEETINRFFGATLPKGDFAIPTAEQKLAIFSKIRIPKHLQDSCQIAIQGGEKNSFLRIKLGKDIDITCSGDVKSIGWTSSLDGMMLDWRSKSLIAKHRFNPDAAEFLCNKEVFQTHFRVIHSIFPNILDRDDPRDRIILDNHDNLFSQIIRTPSYRLPRIKADQEKYIEKHEMTIKKATYFRYNFALLLENLFNKFPSLFPDKQKEEIAEDLKIYKSFIEDYEKDMDNEDIAPKELFKPVEGSKIRTSHSKTRQ